MSFGISAPELDLWGPADDVDGKGPMNMDEKARVLKLLSDRPQDAGVLSSLLGISRHPLFSLLMKMEKEDLIVWTGKEWAVKPASD